MDSRRRSPTTRNFTSFASSLSYPKMDATSLGRCVTSRRRASANSSAVYRDRTSSAVSALWVTVCFTAPFTNSVRITSASPAAYRSCSSSHSRTAATSTFVSAISSSSLRPAAAISSGVASLSSPVTASVVFPSLRVRSRLPIRVALSTARSSSTSSSFSSPVPRLRGVEVPSAGVTDDGERDRAAASSRISMLSKSTSSSSSSSSPISAAMPSRFSDMSTGCAAASMRTPRTSARSEVDTRLHTATYTTAQVVPEA